MDWYYAENNQRMGPVSEVEFFRLVDSGVITGSTLVWREGMGDWTPYESLEEDVIPSDDIYSDVEMGPMDDVATGYAEQAPGASPACAECGRIYPEEEMIQYGGAYVCATCKPIFFQRIREGGALPETFVYGGFWIRFVARIIDYVILMALQFMLLLVLMPLAATGDETASLAAMILQNVIGFAVGVTYEVYFLGRFGATPGKMACGLRVIRPDGSSISYVRALGRYFATILSGIIFLLGYIMAAFDPEKRALHDHICDTRVIRT